MADAARRAAPAVPTVGLAGCFAWPGARRGAWSRRDIGGGRQSSAWLASLARARRRDRPAPFGRRSSAVRATDLEPDRHLSIDRGYRLDSADSERRLGNVRAPDAGQLSVCTGPTPV